MQPKKQQWKRLAHCKWFCFWPQVYELIQLIAFTCLLLKFSGTAKQLLNWPSNYIKLICVEWDLFRLFDLVLQYSHLSCKWTSIQMICISSLTKPASNLSQLVGALMILCAIINRWEIRAFYSCSSFLLIPVLKKYE